MKMPKISVVIPLYNKEKTIKGTIESVLSQSFQDFELLIVNDGSTDNSVKVVKSIPDNRIKLIDKRNEGVSATRNRGAKEASGDYILFLDADDLLTSDSFEEFLRTEEKYPNADVYIGSYEEIDSMGNVAYTQVDQEVGYINNPLKALWKLRIHIRMGNFLIKRDILLHRIGLMSQDLTLYEDYEWLLRVLSSCTVASTKRIVLRYVRAEGGLSFHTPPFNKEFASRIRLKGKTGFERKILANHLFKRLIRRVLQKDFKAIVIVIFNNFGFCFYSFFCYLARLKYRQPCTKQ